MRASLAEAGELDPVDQEYFFEGGDNTPEVPANQPTEGGDELFSVSDSALPADGGTGLAACGSGRCLGQGLAYGAAVVNYGWRAWKLWGVIAAIAPPAAAVAEAVTLGTVAVVALAGATVTMVSCLQED